VDPDEDGGQSMGENIRFYFTWEKCLTLARIYLTTVVDWGWQIVIMLESGNSPVKQMRFPSDFERFQRTIPATTHYNTPFTGSMKNKTIILSYPDVFVQIIVSNPVKTSHKSPTISAIKISPIDIPKNPFSKSDKVSTLRDPIRYRTNRQAFQPTFKT
jgi:hypothetical protein